MQPNSLTLTNGIIHTLNPRQPRATTLVIREGRVAAVGDEGLRALHGDIDQVIDLDGACIVPGFIDTHVHFTITGLGLLALDVTGVGDIDTMLDQITQRAEGLPHDHLILASGFQPELNAERRFPSARELDNASGGRPVYVMERGGHWSAVNAAALALLPIGAETEGIERDAQGEPTGVLTGPANMAAFTGLWRVFKQQAGVRPAFEQAAQLALAGGVTTVHALDDLEDVEALLSLQDALPVRLVPYTQTHDVVAVRRLGLRQIGGCGQVALDGDFGPRTAALLEPYTDQPHTCGTLYFSDDDVYGYVEGAHRAGMQVALHCVGSGAIEQLLKTYEAVLAKYPRIDHRHRIEHFELPAPGQAERARQLGVLLALQPSFNHFWPHDTEYPVVIGAERAERVDPVRSVLDGGIEAAFGSDSPVTPMRGLLWMHAAVNHSNPTQRIDAATALRLSTAAGARFAFEEADKGTLEPGKLADLAILDRDPLRVPPGELEDVRVLRTIVGGRVVHEI